MWVLCELFADVWCWCILGRCLWGKWVAMACCVGVVCVVFIVILMLCGCRGWITLQDRGAGNVVEFDVGCHFLGDSGGERGYLFVDVHEERV